jgi:kynurenine formamidase
MGTAESVLMNTSCVELLQQALGCARIVDLSYTLETGMPAWPTQARYSSVVYESYDQGDAAVHSGITLSEHTGTHIDAPRHFVKGACPVDKLPLEAIMGRAYTMDASFLSPKAVLSSRAIQQFEEAHGPIEKGDIVMFRFGWDKKYRIQPGSGEYLKNWPGLAGEGAEYLLLKGVKAVGCDALSLDAYGDDSNPCHHALLGNGVPIIENITNLWMLPVVSFVIGLPNKFKDGSGSPVRLTAFVDPGKIKGVWGGAAGKQNSVPGTEEH